jgi:hypothetical protein
LPNDRCILNSLPLSFKLNLSKVLIHRFYYIDHGSDQKSTQCDQQRTRTNLIISKGNNRNLQQGVLFIIGKTLTLYQHQHSRKILHRQRIQKGKNCIDVEKLDKMV